MTNKQVTGSYNDLEGIGKFNRVGGIEFNLANNDNRWTGKAFYHQSFYPGHRQMPPPPVQILLQFAIPQNKPRSVLGGEDLMQRQDI